MIIGTLVTVWSITWLLVPLWQSDALEDYWYPCDSLKHYMIVGTLVTVWCITWLLVPLWQSDALHDYWYPCDSLKHYMIIGPLVSVLFTVYNCTWLVYTHIDQTVMNSLQGLLNCEIGGLDCRAITTEYISHVHCIHRYHLFCNALVHIIHSGVSGQCSHIIHML